MVASKPTSWVVRGRNISLLSTALGPWRRSGLFPPRAQLSPRALTPGVQKHRIRSLVWSVGGEAPAGPVLYSDGQCPGPALKLFRGERDISGFDRFFHPYPRVIPSSSTEGGFGLHGGYPASPCPWIAHTASRPRHATQIALFRLAKRCGSVSLNLAACRDSQAHSIKRHAVTVVGTAPAAWGRTVSGAVSLPSRATFPRGTGSPIGHRRGLSLGGWSPCFGPGFTCPALLIADRSPRPSRTGFYRCGRPSYAVPPRTWFSAAAGAWGPWALRPATPRRQRPQPWRRRRFGLARFRSLLLARSRLISPPSGYLDVSVPRLSPRKDGLQSGSRP